LPRGFGGGKCPVVLLVFKTSLDRSGVGFGKAEELSKKSTAR